MIAFCPWEAIQITDVLGYLFPGIKSGPILYNVMGYDIYLVVIVIGAVFSLLIFALNMRGLAAAAVAQKILCLVLVVAAIIGAVAAVIGGNAGNWQPLYDVSNPDIYGPSLKEVSHHSMFDGMFAIVTSAAFFLAGFETIPQGVEEAGGDVKSVGKTVVLSIFLACIFYAILLFAYGYGWPWQDFAGMPRPAACTMFLSLFPGPAGTFLYWLLTIGAMAGLLTSWNGFFAGSANLLMGMGRGKLIPNFLSRQNQRGIAFNAMIVCLVLSIIGPFLGATLVDTITCYSAVAFELSWCLTAWSLVGCRVRFPEMKRPYQIPGGTAMGWFAAIVSSIVVIASFIPASPFYIGSLAIKMFVGWMVIGLILFLASGVQRRNLTEQELEDGVFGSVMKQE